MSVYPIEEVRNLDVLAEETSGPPSVLFEVGKQIGNNRFNVLIDMHLSKYKSNDSNNNQEECNKIIRTILEVTCHRHTDDDGQTGRFIVTTKSNSLSEKSSNTWRELSEKEAQQLIRSTFESRLIHEEITSLEPIPIHEESAYGNLTFEQDERNSVLTQQSTLRRSRSASNMKADARIFLDGYEYESVVDEENDRFEPMPIQISSIEFETTCTEFPLSINNENVIEGVGSSSKKRGRRRSLLRRSNSFESGLKFSTKKTLKNLTGSHGEMFYNNSTIGKLVPTHQGMDIVFEENCLSLSTKSNITGNNRLDIMLSLERESFFRLTSVEQKEAALEIVNTVTLWNGRILVDKGYAYSILSYDEAADAMTNILLNGNNTCPSTSSSAKVTKNLSSSSITSSFRNTLLSAAPALPAFLKNASNDILHSCQKSNEVTPEERQSDAVRIMKERMKKRQEAKEKAKKKNIN